MFLLFILVYSFVTHSSAQPGEQTREAFLNRNSNLLERGGVWEAVNPEYDSTQEWSATHYGYKFEKGYHENFLKLKINGLVKGKRYLYWEGYYFWNPAKKRAEYFSIGTGGAYAMGEVINGNHDLQFRIITPEGVESLHLDKETIISPDEFHSLSYKQENGTWKEQNKLIWKRVTEK